ncbi:MAG: dihydroorotate dehydrogenase electron transfer subunit [Candidatus Omnitrophota bacterium]|nr:dihydroorotate dehydrogenase electron transfer subunit [Candidatus Omnitrophota bacterium]
MAKRIIAKVISQEELKEGCFRMALEAPYIAKTAEPGQFLHVRCGDSTDPLLRRPLSIHRIGKKNIEILYNVAGKGTGILSGKKKDGKIDLIGPLGNGFTIRKKSNSLKMLVAGGMGVAPLLGLAEKLSGRGRVKRKKKFIVILGAGTQNHILCEREFKKLGGEIHIATEDGSKGKKALATELAEEVINSNRYKWKDVCIYGAGPIGMVRALCRLMEGCSIESQVSLEEKMACGVGACMGCVVDTQSGYKRVCKDGPVFNMCEVI